MSTLSEGQAAMLEFIDNEYLSLVQALRHMAEANESNAKAMDADGQRLIAKVCRESVEVWNDKADKLAALYELAYPIEGV